ncbi:IstB-like ATP-binding protein domain protein, partial [mine drainage metagenome]
MTGENRRWEWNPSLAVPLNPDAANVLFQVVNERYLHRRPMVFTTNKPIEAWGEVLHDGDLAEAILDRVLERGRVLHFKGPSYRTLGSASRNCTDSFAKRGGRVTRTHS